MADRRLTSWDEWYRFARRELGYAHGEAVATPMSARSRISTARGACTERPPSSFADEVHLQEARRRTQTSIGISGNVGTVLVAKTALSPLLFQTAERRPQKRFSASAVSIEMKPTTPVSFGSGYSKRCSKIWAAALAVATAFCGSTRHAGDRRAPPLARGEHRPEPADDRLPGNPHAEPAQEARFGRPRREDGALAPGEPCPTVHAAYRRVEDPGVGQACSLRA